MPTFDIETEEITVFEIGGTYIFKQYFDENQLFKQLEKYYNEDKYRFEIPEDDLEQVRQVLEKYYYKLEVADSVDAYCVVVDKKSDSSNILRNSVMRKEKRQHEVIVIKNKLSKKQAIEQGAVSIEKSEVTEEELAWKPR
ncbi:hypothetical protein [Halovenus sp. HT40]|uniref:hypothetical protein n=1 Tax=Halovenus sp. HT40 TaxID=3126691 RepID=UPI00300F781C